MEISPGERNPSATEAERADSSAGAEAPPSGVASRVGLPTTNTPPGRALRHQPPHGQQRRRPSHLRPLRAPRPAGGGRRRSAAFLPSSVGGLLRRLSPLCPTQAYRLSQPHKPPPPGTHQRGSEGSCATSQEEPEETALPQRQSSSRFPPRRCQLWTSPSRVRTTFLPQNPVQLDSDWTTLSRHCASVFAFLLDLCQVWFGIMVQFKKYLFAAYGQAWCSCWGYRPHPKTDEAYFLNLRTSTWICSCSLMVCLHCKNIQI